MKVVSDLFPNAEETLTELLDLEEKAYGLWEHTTPYAECSKVYSLSEYIYRTTTELRNSVVPNFEISYPHIHDLVLNGAPENGPSFSRLYDCIYKMGEAQKEIHSKGYVLVQESDRQQLHDMMADVVADLVVFIMVYYKLYLNEETTLAVQSYCEKNDMKLSVLSEALTSELEAVERTWYAYEPISPYYEGLLSYNEQLVGELEEDLIPFSDKMAKDLIEGKLLEMQVRAYMAQNLKQNKTASTDEDGDSDLTPGTLLSKMSLK